MASSQRTFLCVWIILIILVWVKYSWVGEMTTFFLPDLLYRGDGEFSSGVGLEVSADGRIVGIAEKPEMPPAN